MRKLLPTLLVLTAILAACDNAQTAVTEVNDPPAFGVAPGNLNVVDLANGYLEAAGLEYRVAYAEYVTIPGAPASQNIIIANDRGNKQVGLNFIPDDPRRDQFDGNPNTIDYVVDLVDGATASGLSVGTTTAAIARAMATWDAVTCSHLGINGIAVGVDLGLVQWALGFGSTPAPIAVSDIMHAGWLPGAFFDLVQPNGSSFILGVTFTLVFTSGDLDGNGQPDLGARETYYNDAFAWNDAGVTATDVETVALHESGHGLSQAHFGKIFFEPHSGTFHFSPLAVMNAGIASAQRTLLGTDVAGHCSIWDEWPN